jgi:hypothetical protein
MFSFCKRGNFSKKVRTPPPPFRHFGHEPVHPPKNNNKKIKKKKKKSNHQKGIKKHF